MNGHNGLHLDQSNFVTGHLLSKFSTGKPGTYVLNSSAVSDYQKFAVALSNRVVKVYDINGEILDEYVHEKDITDIKFCSTEPSCLFTSSLNGKLSVWDSRCQGPVQTFIDNSDDVLKPLLCFDYHTNEKLFCAGTELFREDSFLVFWDRRTTEILGGYWNCHTDDITQIHFHPSKTSTMASSSVDGLINVFDLHEKSEDDALKYTLNVGSAVNKCHWKSSDFVSCITSMEEYQTWPVTEASPTFCTSREKLSSNYKTEVDCMIDSLEINNKCYLVTGTYDGMVHLWDNYKNGLSFGYLLKEHSDVVRTVCFISKEEVILTGGEDGCVCLWKLTTSDA